MPRLNNKDYTVEELERLIALVGDMLHGNAVGCDDELRIRNSVCDEIEELIKGSQFTSFEGEKKLEPIPWNFKFEMLINPETRETADVILNAMRSSEVNENIKKRFNAIIREEVNWYIDRVKYFMVKGDTNILE